MMHGIRRGVALVVGLLITWIAGSVSNAGPSGTSYVSLTSADPIVVARAAAGEERPTLLMVTTASGYDLGQLDIEVLSISRDGAVQPVRTNAIDVRSSEPPPALVLNINFDALFEPGSYELTLGIVPRAGSSADAAAPQQQLVVKLVLPAAAVQPISKIVIDRELPLPLSNLWGRVEPKEITVEEVSNASSIAPEIHQEGPLLSGDRPIGAQVVKTQLDRIEPGSTGKASLQLEGTFPIGKVSGTLELTAHELAGPVTIPIEIRTHHPAWWVACLFLIGAFAGLQWRTIMVNKRDALTAKIRVVQLTEQVDAFLADYPPDWVDVEIATLRTRRTEVRDDNEGTLLALQDALVQARALRDKHVASLANEIRDGVAMTRTAWRLPAGLHLDKAASSYDFARAELTSGDLVQAVNWADNGAAEIERVLAQGRQWCNRLAKILVTDDGLVCGVPSSARQAVRDSSTKLRDLLNAAIATSDQQEDALKNLHEAWQAASDLASLFQQAFAAFERGLPPNLPADQLASLRMACALAPSRPEMPDVTISDAIAASRRVRDAVQTAAGDLHDQQLPQDLEKLIDAGEFAQALARPGTETAEGRGAPASARQTGTVSVGLDMRIAAPHVSESPPVPPVVPVEKRAARTPSQVFELKLDRISKLRWVLAAAVTSLAAWALYGDAFVGTRVECVSIFALGFVTDLTTDSAIDGFLERLKGLRAVPTAGPPADTSTRQSNG